MKNKTKYYLVNAVVLILLFLMDGLFPYAIDDYIYGSVADPQSVGEAITASFSAISNFFFTWGNRVVGNYFAYLMVFLDKSVYNVCNAFIHVILGNIMYAYIRPKERYNYKLLLAIFLGMWLFVPEYGMTIIWTNASTIYQWVMIPLLLFGYVYYKTLFEEDKQKNDNTICMVLIIAGNFVLGIIAGNTLEPAVCTLLLGGFIWLIWCYNRKRKLKPWEISGIIGCLISFAVLILGPGSAARAKVVREEIGEQNMFYEFVYRLVRETYYTIAFLGILIGLSIVLIMVAYEINKSDLQLSDNIEVVVQKGKLQDLKRYVIEILTFDWRAPVFLILAIVSIYVMTFSIAFANRIFLTPTILLIISCLISVENILTGGNVPVENVGKKVCTILLVFVSVFVLTQYTTAMMEMYQTGEPFIKTTMFVNYSQDLF